MGVTAGVATHRTTVKVYDGQHIEAGELVRYEGPPDWKFEPLDEAAAATWREETARPERALSDNLRTGAVIRAPMSAAELAAEAQLRRQRSAPIRIA